MGSRAIPLRIAHIAGFFHHPFFAYFSPNDQVHRNWFTEAWRVGLDSKPSLQCPPFNFDASKRAIIIADPTDRTFVVEDTEKDNKLVGFSRWVMPQQDGNLERKVSKILPPSPPVS